MKTHRVKEIVYLAEIVAVLTYDELSMRKVATQSTTSLGPYDLYRADNAVDRNITTCMRTDMIGITSPYRTVWWRVDLGGVYNIYSVNILFKNYDGSGIEKRQQGRVAGFSLYVSNTGGKNGSCLCYKDGPQLPPLNFTTICTLSGRYVIFYNERLDGVTYPEGYELSSVWTELCEVIVNGCSKPGVYSNNCDVPCPINCRYNTCHIVNGTCFECEPGWTGTTCNTKCALGWYGHECKNQCSGHCKDDVPCNHVTGHCDGGCAAGWRDSYCVNACKDGYYGPNCSRACSANCKTCDRTDGRCSCFAGWSGPNCSLACHKSYGENCQIQCSSLCRNQTCDRYNGTCLPDELHAKISDCSCRGENTCTVGVSLSLGLNAIFIIAALFLLGRHYSKLRLGMIQSCWESPLHEKSKGVTEQEQTYQELNLQANHQTYQELNLQNIPNHNAS